jgi:hypothetical protein
VYRLPDDAARLVRALRVLAHTGSPGVKELQNVLDPALRAAAALLRLAHSETSLRRFLLDIFERLPAAVLERGTRDRLMRLLNARGGADWLDNPCEAVAHLLDNAIAGAGRAGRHAPGESSPAHPVKEAVRTRMPAGPRRHRLRGGGDPGPLARRCGPAGYPGGARMRVIEPGPEIILCYRPRLAESSPARFPAAAPG